MKITNYSEKNYEVFDVFFKNKTDLIEYVKSAQTSRVFAYKKLASQTETNEYNNWAGVSSFDQAVNLFENGWYENFEQFLSTKKAIDKFFPYIIKNYVYQNSINGGIPNVFNLINNIPGNMRKKVLEEKKNVVSIWVDATHSWTLSKEGIFNYGVIILAFIDFFESLGYRVDLKFFEIIRAGNQIVFIRNMIKDVSEKINMQKVYFPFCHPAYLRRILFRVLETTEGIRTSFCSGYGHILRTEEIRDVLNLKDNDILFSSMSSGIKGEDLMEDVKTMINYVQLGNYIKPDSSYTVVDNKNVLSLDNKKNNKDKKIYF